MECHKAKIFKRVNKQAQKDDIILNSRRKTNMCYFEKLTSTVELGFNDHGYNEFTVITY